MTFVSMIFPCLELPSNAYILLQIIPNSHYYKVLSLSQVEHSAEAERFTGVICTVWKSLKFLSSDILIKPERYQTYLMALEMKNRGSFTNNPPNTESYFPPPLNTVRKLKSLSDLAEA